MDDLPDIARQAIAAGLDLVRWDQEMNDLRGDAEGDQDAEADEHDAQQHQSHDQYE